MAMVMSSSARLISAGPQSLQAVVLHALMLAADQLQHQQTISCRLKACIR